MTRKTKVRIVGEPQFCEKVAQVILDHFEVDKCEKFDRAVGRDYAHSNAPGCSIYITVKKPKEVSA